MLKLIRTYLKPAVFGFSVAGALVAMLFWMDTGQLRSVVAISGSVWLAAALMWLCVGAIFAGVQCALAAKDSNDDDDSSPRGGGRREHPHHGEMIPVHVDAKHHSRRPKR